MVFIGVFVAIVVRILGIPVLAFAIGLYLPIHLSTPIMVGGAVRWFLESRKNKSEEEKKGIVEKGILYSAGMIAGEGIVGILLAIFAVIGIGDFFNISGIYGDNFYAVGNWVGIVCFAGLVATIFLFARNKKKN